MGTSPFGALRLTSVPIPCVSVTFLGNRTQDCQCILEITKDTKDTKGFWMIRGLVIGDVGRCPTPRQGEVLPAPPARPMDVPEGRRSSK